MDAALKRLNRWGPIILHFSLSITTALVVILAVDGYKALDGSSTSRTRNGKFKFRSGDIITLLSAATVILGVTASLWSGVVLWNCASSVWDQPDKTTRLAEIKWIVDFKVPRLTREKIKGSVWIALALLPLIPQPFSAPILEGSLDWKSSFEHGSKQPVGSRNPTSNFPLWRYFSRNSKVPYQLIDTAAGLIGVAWDNSTRTAAGAVNKRCRHVTNDQKFPAGSMISNVTIPCIVVHNITWSDSPMPSQVAAVVDDASKLLASGVNLFANSDYPGMAVVFDPSNKTLPLPPVFGSQNTTNSTVLTEFLVPTYPSPFMFSGKMTAIVQLLKRYNYDPRLVDLFGYTHLNNSYGRGFIWDLETSYRGSDATYTSLEIEFTAGIATPESNTYVNSRVIESGPLDPVTSDISPGPWVKEALYLMPEVMSTVAVMNITSLSTWNNIVNYTENLLRYSYQGAWDMLHNQFEPNNINLTAILAEPRLQASVSKPRVAGWLVIQGVFVLTFFPVLMLRKKHHRLGDGPKELIQKAYEDGKKETGTESKDLDGSKTPITESKIESTYVPDRNMTTRTT